MTAGRFPSVLSRFLIRCGASEVSEVAKCMIGCGKYLEFTKIGERLCAPSFIAKYNCWALVTPQSELLSNPIDP